jgi:hypothetical protein
MAEAATNSGCETKNPEPEIAMNARTNKSTRLNVENLERRDVPAQLATVNSVIFGDGSSQRSMVRQITVNLTNPAEISDSVASAFSLHHRASSSAASDGDVGLIIKNIGQMTSTLTIAFDGSLTQAGGSLVDGYYDFSVDTSKVSVKDDLGGLVNSVHGDSSTVTGTLTNKFFRLAGDCNGDGRVNQTDMNLLRSAYKTDVSMFDLDGDGEVTQADLMALRARYNIAL